MPSTAAPNTIAPKSLSDGASLPLAPDAENPRAGAQSDSSGQQGLAPAQVEQQTAPAAGEATTVPSTGAATENPAPAAGGVTEGAAAPAEGAAPANGTAPATTTAPAATTAPASTTAPADAVPETTGDTGVQTYTVPVTPKPAD